MAALPAVELEPEASLDEKANILLVDDRPENLLALSTVLSDLGQNLVEAESGREALRRLLEDDFAVILLDVRMPGMDGFETAALIRARERTRHTPIVFLTAANRNETDVSRGYAVGAVDFLLKPLVPEVLKAKVQAFVELWRKNNELQVEIRRRMQAEEEVRQLNQDLERRVAERTAALRAVNRDLKNEITERKRAEALRDDLTHMIVHDLRTPLTSLITGIQTVMTMGDLEHDRQECLEMALQGSQILLGMINDLLDISKLEDGSLRLHLGTLDARHLVGSAVQQVASLIRDKNLTLEQEFAPDLDPFRGDEEKLRRTLVNLLGNAIKFTPERGNIHVAVGIASLADGASGVAFSVSDTGEGIPREAFGRIFEKFGQVEDRQGRGSTRSKMSTGLGLTFCKMVVEAHGGHIGVVSELEKGSTFTFVIPHSPK